MGPETFMWLAIICTLNRDMYFKLRDFIKPGLDTIKSTADSIWTKIVEMLDEDYANLILDMVEKFKESTGEFSPEELLQIIIPGQLLKADNIEIFQGVMMVLKRQRMCNADIDSFVRSIENIVNGYYDSRDLPSFGDNSIVSISPFQSSVANVVYDKRAVAFAAVSLYIRQFTNTLSELSKSSYTQDKETYIKVREAFSLFVKKISESNTLNKKTISEKILMRTPNESAAYKALHDRTEMLIIKIDTYQQNFLNKQTSGVLNGLKGNLFELQRLFQSIVLRRCDKHAIKYIGNLHSFDISQGRLGNQTKVEFSGRRPAIKLDGRIPIFTQRRFEFVNWSQVGLDYNNPVSQMVKYFASLNDLNDRLEKSLSACLFRLSDVQIKDSRIKKSKKYIPLKRKNLPKIMEDIKLKDKDLQQVQFIICQLFKGIDFLTTCIYEYECRRNELGHRFYETGEDIQFLAITHAAVEYVLDQYSNFSGCKYIVNFEARLSPCVDEELKDNIAIDRNVKTVQRCVDPGIKMGPSQFYQRISDLPVGTNIASPIHHDRVEFKQAIANFSYWYQELKEERNYHVKQGSLELKSNLQNLNNTDIILAIYFWHNKELYELVDKNSLKPFLCSLVDCLFEFSIYVTQFNNSSLRITAIQKTAIENKLALSENNLMNLIKIENNKIELNSHKIMGLEQFQGFQKVINILEAVLEGSTASLCELQEYYKLVHTYTENIEPAKIKKKVVENNGEQKLHWFFLVHAMLYQSQGIFKRTKIKNDSNLCEIEQHILRHPNSRSAVAMKIVEDSILGRFLTKKKVVSVFKAVYRKSFHHSIFNHGREHLLSESLSLENILEYAERAGSRTQKVMSVFKEAIPSTIQSLIKI